MCLAAAYRLTSLGERPAVVFRKDPTASNNVSAYTTKRQQRLLVGVYCEFVAKKVRSTWQLACNSRRNSSDSRRQSQSLPGVRKRKCTHERCRNGDTSYNEHPR